MFFIMQFSKDVIVSPSDLSKDLKKIIRVKLLEQITGTCSPKYGYIIKVLNIGESGNGIIMEGSGDIIFKTEYKVVLMRPFKGEICDGIIDTVFEEGGIHVKVGPMIVHIAKDDMQPNYILNRKDLCYVNEKENIELKKGTKVRFRFKEIQFDKNEFKPIGTMRDNYLGYIQDN